jgi:hypothetical protein
MSSHRRCLFTPGNNQPHPFAEKDVSAAGEMMLDRYTKPIWTHRFLICFAILGLAIVFCGPYFFSMQATASYSYDFGYNNRVGIILLALILGIGAIWTRGMGISFLPATDSKPVPRILLIASLLAVFLGCVAMYAFAGRFGGFGESSYNIDRVWLLSRGNMPYTSFEWAYGASFLYVPLFLSHALSIDVVRAYYIFWGLNFLVGTWMLFAVVNMIDYPTTKKTTVFLLIMGTAYSGILTMGANYALLRHICPIFFVLLVQRLFHRGSIQWRIFAALLALVFTAVLLLISPETAVAHAFACIVTFLLDDQHPSAKSLGLIAALTIGFALVFWVAYRFHVMDTMLAFGAGANNFPIIPAPHLLLFFGGLFLCVCYIYRRLLDRSSNDNTLCLISYSIPMASAALGRCDAGHVFVNGLGVFLACLFYVSGHAAAWKLCRNAFLLFITLLPTIEGLWLYRRVLANVCLDTVVESNNSNAINEFTYLTRRWIAPHLRPDKRGNLEARLESLERHSGMSQTVSLSKIYPEWHGEFAAPFGYRPNGFGTDLTSRIDYGFYEGLENAITPAAIRRKINDLALHPEEALLLYEHFDENCLVDAAAERQFISGLFFFPYPRKVIHPDNVFRPLCDYIHSQYIRMDTAAADNKSNYGLWVQKTITKLH